MESTPERRVFFFDIDNCLYPPSLGIDKLMKQRIYAFGSKIGLAEDQVMDICSTYYRTYGLSVRGLIKHHEIDPVDFNEQVDRSLPLEEIIKPDPELRKMIASIKTRRWAFTNAGVDHAQRVLANLGVADLFEGITYCDYSEPDFPCKPERLAYERVMKQAGVSDPTLCYFADDSADNVIAAKEMGWTAVHVSVNPNRDAGDAQITRIHDLPRVFPDLFE